MAKYNLMDNQRPDYFDRYFDEEDEVKEPSKKQPDEFMEIPAVKKESVEFFDESLFAEEKETETMEDPSGIDIEISDNEPLDITDEKPDFEESAPPKPQRTFEPSPEEKPDLEYKDEKMQKINLKPILIGVLSLIALVAIVFVLFQFVFVSSDDPLKTGDAAAEQKPAIDPQEQLRLEQERKKVSFIKNLNNEKNARLDVFSNLADLQVKNVSYASMLLYDKAISFEIFSPSRDDVAKYNMNLKQKNLNDKYKISYVSNRPGTKGGVFALYSAELGSSAGTGAAQGEPTIELNIQQKVNNVAKKYNLKTKSEISVSRTAAAQFERIRIEYIYTGSEENCNKYLDELSKMNSNFNVYKISLMPTNQNNFSKMNFQLLIILDFYV